MVLAVLSRLDADIGIVSVALQVPFSSMSLEKHSVLCQ
jgi:hypothetical protein